MDANEIVRIASRGEGVTGDGRFVPLAAPADRIHADGSIIPGPHHAVPPCRHFPKCGGCQLQHIDDDAFAGFIVQRIAGALHAQGLDLPELSAPHISPPRSRVRASLRAERIGKRVVIGFNEAASHRIVDMRQCEVLVPELFALIAPLREMLPLLLRDRRAATVQMTMTDGGVDVMIDKVSIEGLAATEALTDFAQANSLARLSVDEGYGAEARWEPEPVTVTLGGMRVAFPPGGFLQATKDGEQAISGAVSRIMATSVAVADLFAGLGTFTLGDVPVILAVEGQRSSASALKLAAARAQRPLVVEHRDLFRRALSADELNRHDGVILDPPRSGAREQVDELAKSKVRRIAYVSCNPATFARDAKVLVEGGYALREILPVGQFRWSTHIELVGHFER